MFDFTMETDYKFNWEDLNGRDGTIIVTEDSGFVTVTFYCKTGNTFVIYAGKPTGDES